MKKIFTILAVVVVSAVMNAQATEVLNEQFSFTGSLNTGNNGWYMHSGALNQLVADGSVVTLVSGNVEDSNKALSVVYALANNNASKVDYSVDVKVVNDILLTSTGDYFLSLTGTVTTSDVTTGISALPARLFVKKGTSGYLLGTVNNSSVGVPAIPTYTTVEIPYGVQVNAKVTYEVAKDAAGTVLLQRSTLTVGSETVTNTIGTTAPPPQIAGIAIREGGNTGNITLDNIVVNTYAPTSLAVSDVDAPKIILVKNTNINNTIVFGVNANVKIVNVNGQVVKSASVTENSALDVSSLPKGLYIVTAEIDGQKVSQKVIKN